MWCTMLKSIEPASSTSIDDISSEDVFANFVEMIYQAVRMPDISAEDLKGYKQSSLELLSELFDRKEFELLDKLTGCK